ncbi:MAG: Peptidyl-prolyl cis-trans isomerase D [Syntrophus sp. SKADARSKE-3]|nr:Peptidyl-prolyl cis-trans isomerase D [Syntrophus sp. SKADARSKE-3]
MLDLMRQHAKNWMMKAILGIIIIVFVFYFGSTSGRNKADALVTIDGKTISRMEFDKQYQDIIEMYRQRFGGRLTDEMIKALKLKEQVMDKIVYEAILIKKAQELHINVSDEELKSIIASTPAFQRNGVFDEKLYQQMLRYNRMKPEDFEIAQKKNLLVTKLEDLLQDGITVTDQEIYNFYRITNEKINLSWTRILVKDMQKDIRPQAADLEKFLKENSADFRIPEQIRIQYAFFAPSAYAGRVQVSDEEVQEAYNRFKAKAGKTDKVQPLSSVRDKLVGEIKHSKGMRIAYEEAKKAHDVIYQQNNFDAYAAQNHLSIASTGFFSVKNPPADFKPVNDFAKIAFALQKDDISNILSSENGYYLIRLAEKKAAYTPAVKDIEPELRRKYAELESRRLAKQMADRLLERMKKGESLNKIAAEQKLTVSETGFFRPSTPPSQLGTSPELQRALFQLSSQKPYADQVFEADGAFVLIEFKQKEQGDDSDFAKQKDSLRNTLLKIKRGEAIQSWMESVKAEMIKDGRIKYHKDLKEI